MCGYWNNRRPVPGHRAGSCVMPETNIIKDRPILGRQTNTPEDEEKADESETEHREKIRSVYADF